MKFKQSVRCVPISYRALTLGFAALISSMPGLANAQANARTAPVAPQAAPSQGNAVTVAQDLANPWGLAFLPGGRFLVTERSGRLRVVEANGRVNQPISGVPPVVFGGQGGLLDVVTDADFERNRRIFFCYSEPGAKGEPGNSTALASAVLPAGETALSDVRVIFSQRPKVQSSLHFGCRIAQARDGSLFLTLGERSTRKEDAQKLDGYLGKVVHLQPDGSPGPGNPVVAGAAPGIWSWGHRNPQGATIAPDGQLWINEHGPQGGDEVNVPQAGRNYGWPVVTHGENYGGGKIGEGLTHKEGMEPPLHYWVPSIAPSGMAFLTSDRYGADWRGSLFIGSLKFSRLHRLVVADGKVVRDETLLSGLGERIRDVRQGPDGWLYLLTDGPQGRLLRLTR
ncbi:Glucose/arabinose dehydrogenase, beta-propeller fold [Paracidovorax valerianellae]|uniref:Glucose/arabinose dehydrogenase, beta-propeller fold n=2 Tax=Paracidovorax valerianellae TaxID=187868 RepID=A0A1G6I316_9BURK|nr:Glucose/arabinose dehydrogenase, beta-propeller fold [Paracidovorax valerianellae]